MRDEKDIGAMFECHISISFTVIPGLTFYRVYNQKVPSLP